MTVDWSGRVGKILLTTAARDSAQWTPDNEESATELWSAKQARNETPANGFWEARTAHFSPTYYQANLPLKSLYYSLFSCPVFSNLVPKNDFRAIYFFVVERRKRPIVYIKITATGRYNMRHQHEDFAEYVFNSLFPCSNYTVSVITDYLQVFLTRYSFKIIFNF